MDAFVLLWELYMKYNYTQSEIKTYISLGHVYLRAKCSSEWPGLSIKN